jgi:hypothetical protein
MTTRSAPRRTRRALIGATATMLALTTACSSSASGPAPLALGASATVQDVSPASGTTPAVDTSFTVTVLAVRKGAVSDLTSAGYSIDADQMKDTPYYVDVRWTNAGTGEATRNQVISVEDPKLGGLTSLTLVSLDGSSFDTCKPGDGSAFHPGDTYESCAIFFLPAGRAPTTVRFVSQAKNGTITFTDWKPN